MLAPVKIVNIYGLDNNKKCTHYTAQMISQQSRQLLDNTKTTSKNLYTYTVHLSLEVNTEASGTSDYVGDYVGINILLQEMQ